MEVPEQKETCGKHCRQKYVEPPSMESASRNERNNEAHNAYLHEFKLS